MNHTAAVASPLSNTRLETRLSKTRMPIDMTLKYVPEFDGLRAIAVLGVLIYHLGFRFFPGGFVGVDVFFVISGFLISKIIIKDLANGTFSIAAFYERRFRRIVPALAFTLAGTILVFTLISSPKELEVQQKSLLATLLSVSNLYFYLTTDYFNNNASNPFLHTWSLAVEEQFYLIFPLVLLAISRWSQGRQKLLLSLLGLGSFVAASIYVYRDASAAFYLPWLRAWELMAGTALALIPLHRIKESRKVIASYLGPILILIAFVLFEEHMRFPGASALLPVAGAALTIAGAGVRSAPNRVLSSTIPVWVGKISYSLYLVHWPAICALNVLGLQVSDKLKMIALLGCLLMAWLSYRFVEQPFRRPGPSRIRRTYIGTAAALVMLGVFGVAGAAVTNFLWEKSPRALQLLDAQNDPHAHYGPKSCFLGSKTEDFSFYDKDVCLHVERDRQNILVMGDSHSAHVMASLKKQFPSSNFLQASASGCLPGPETVGEERCTDLFNYLFNDWLEKNGPAIDLVIVSARWQENNVSDIVAIRDRAKEIGARLIVLGPSPEYQTSLPKILGYSEIYGIDLSTRLLQQKRLIVDQRLREAFPNDILYFSLMKNLCALNKCQSQVDGVPVLSDQDHFTEKGADAALAGLGERVNATSAVAR